MDRALHTDLIPRCANVGRRRSVTLVVTVGRLLTRCVAGTELDVGVQQVISDAEMQSTETEDPDTILGLNTVQPLSPRFGFHQHYQSTLLIDLQPMRGSFPSLGSCPSQLG
jgi:hypothetical protein